MNGARRRNERTILQVLVLDSPTPNLVAANFVFVGGVAPGAFIRHPTPCPATKEAKTFESLKPCETAFSRFSTLDSSSHSTDEVTCVCTSECFLKFPEFEPSY